MRVKKRIIAGAVLLTCLVLSFRYWVFITVVNKDDSIGLLEKWKSGENVALLLIDPSILTNLQSTAKGQNNRCNYLCGLTVPIFGVESRNTFNEVALTDRASAYGLTGRCETEETSWAKGKVYTLCTISTNTAKFYIALLHPRTDSYLWFKNPTSDENIVIDRFKTKSLYIDGLQLLIPTDIPAFTEEYKTAQFIECNATRARVFNKEFPAKQSTKRVEFRNKALQIIRAAKYALDGAHVPFWLSSGTCLGWFRQCDVIPYTSDVDLGVFSRHYDPSLISTMERAGFKLKYYSGQPSDSLVISFTLLGTKLDLFFFYEERDHTWNGATQASTGNKYKYIFKPFTLCRAQLVDIIVHVPCNTQDYIEANYGQNWYVPVTEWDWKLSPPNSFQNGRWSRDEMDDVIRIYQ